MQAMLLPHPVSCWSSVWPTAVAAAVDACKLKQPTFPAAAAAAAGCARAATLLMLLLLLLLQEGR